MYDPELDEEEKRGRFASMANGSAESEMLQPPPSKTIAATVTPSSVPPEPTAKKDSEFDAGKLAKMYGDQAAYHKSQLGPVPNAADDTPSPTIAEAQGQGKPGEYGASASDILSLFGG